MRRYYFAHAVSPVEGETLTGNIAAATALYRAVQRANPEVLVLAPWLLELITGASDDAVPAERAQGLARCLATCEIRDLSGIILAGPRVSTGGMLSELLAVFGSERVVEVHRVRTLESDLRIRPLGKLDVCARIMYHAGRLAPIAQARATEIEILQAIEYRLTHVRPAQ